LNAEKNLENISNLHNLNTHFKTKFICLFFLWKQCWNFD